MEINLIPTRDLALLEELAEYNTKNPAAQLTAEQFVQAFVDAHCDAWIRTHALPPTKEEFERVKVELEAKTKELEELKASMPPKGDPGVVTK